MATRAGSLSILAGVVTLAVAVAAVPVVLGTGVATTLAHRLVSFEAGGGRLAFLAAVVGALLVALVLSRRGLPTSITLALTGSIVGAGLGAGFPLSWSMLGWVLAASLLGPLAAGAVGFVVAPGVRVALGRPPSQRARARRLHRLGFLVQSVAYGANDAEKMVALVAIASGASVNPVRGHAISQALVGICFCAGTLFAVPQMAGRVTEQMVRVRNEGSLSALLVSSAVVLAGSAAGMPLSSTQTSTAALLGGTARLSPQRVRANQVWALGVAWATTLPSAAVLGLVLGALTGPLR